MIRHGHCLGLGLSARWDHERTSDEMDQGGLISPILLLHQCTNESRHIASLLCPHFIMPLFFLPFEYAANVRAINNS